MIIIISFYLSLCFFLIFTKKKKMPNTKLKKGNEKKKIFFNGHILLTKITWIPRKKHEVFVIYNIHKKNFQKKRKKIFLISPNNPEMLRNYYLIFLNENFFWKREKIELKFVKEIFHFSLFGNFLTFLYCKPNSYLSFYSFIYLTK